MKASQSELSTARDALRIGERLKAFRTSKGYSLADLARLTNMSEATLSRVENEQTLVSAHNLYNLSGVLGVDITAFFERDTHPIRGGVRSIARRGEGIPVDTARYSASVLCTELSNKKMHPAVNRVSVRTLEEAGGLSNHPGEEFLHVLSGKLVLHTEFYSPLLLERGDSIYFDGMMGHAYLSGGDETAEILVITTTDFGKAAAS